jgi:hypothetical protein
MRGSLSLSLFSLSRSFHFFIFIFGTLSSRKVFGARLVIATVCPVSFFGGFVHMCELRSAVGSLSGLNVRCPLWAAPCYHPLSRVTPMLVGCPPKAASLQLDLPLGNMIRFSFGFCSCHATGFPSLTELASLVLHLCASSSRLGCIVVIKHFCSSFYLD